MKKKFGSRNYHVMYNRKQKTIYLKGPIRTITPLLIKKAIKFLTQKQKSPDQPIFFFINSQGGDIYPLLKIWHILEPLSKSLITVAISRAESGALSLLQLGKYRFATQDTNFCIHHTLLLDSKGFKSPRQDYEHMMEAAQLNALQLVMLTRHSNSYRKINKMLCGEYDFDVDRALRLNLIDMVVTGDSLKEIKRNALKWLEETGNKIKDLIA